MKNRFRVNLIFSALLVIGLLAGIFAIISATTLIRAAPEAENLDKWVIAAGGGEASNGDIEIIDVLGQPVIGESNDSADINLESGYLTSGDAPTAVDVADFQAITFSTSAVLLTWETSFELNLIGFNLYRGSLPGELYTRLNNDLIPARGMGGMSRLTYTYTDLDVQPGESYGYILEALHTDQPATRYDPVYVTVPTNILYLPLIGR